MISKAIFSSAILSLLLTTAAYGNIRVTEKRGQRRSDLIQTEFPSPRKLSLNLRAIRDTSSLSTIFTLLKNRSRQSRGLQDECLDVYDDLEIRARKSGNEYLRRSVDNWHLVKRQDQKFDLLVSAITEQEEAFKEKYKDDVIELSESLEALEPVTKQLNVIRKYQTEMTKKILNLKSVAVEVSRIGYFHQIKFMSKLLPCMGPIYKQWESLYADLNEEKADKDGITSIAESKQEKLRNEVEAQIREYGEQIEKLFKLANNIMELKIRLKDIGFSKKGDLNGRS